MPLFSTSSIKQTSAMDNSKEKKLMVTWTSAHASFHTLSLSFHESPDCNFKIFFLKFLNEFLPWVSSLYLVFHCTLRGLVTQRKWAVEAVHGSVAGVSSSLFCNPSFLMVTSFWFEYLGEPCICLCRPRINLLHFSFSDIKKTAVGSWNSYQLWSSVMVEFKAWP